MNILFVTDDPGFIGKLTDSCQRVDSSEPSLRDIFDGQLYLEKKNEQRRNGADIQLSLTLSTDGVRLFKSSSLSMWPLWIRINDLPPSIR